MEGRIRNNPPPEFEFPGFSSSGSSFAAKIALLFEIASRGNQDFACSRGWSRLFFFFSWRKYCSFLDCIPCSLERFHPPAGRRGSEWKDRRSPNTMSLWKGDSSNQAVQGCFVLFSFPLSLSFFFFFIFLFSFFLSFFFLFFPFSLRWGKRQTGDRKLICKDSELC